MIEAYVANTTNGQRVAIALRELEIEHQLRYVNLWRFEHKHREFLALNPAGQIPVIIDSNGPSGDLLLTETPAILIYLAEECGRLLPREGVERARALKWLMFQVTDLSGPSAQAAWLRRQSRAFEPSSLAPAISALKNRALSFYRVLDAHLAKSRYLGGDEYSIADIAAYPMAGDFEHPEFGLLSNIGRWRSEVGARGATLAAMAELKQLHSDATTDRTLRTLHAKEE